MSLLRVSKKSVRRVEALTFAREECQDLREEEEEKVPKESWGPSGRSGKQGIVGPIGMKGGKGVKGDVGPPGIPGIKGEPGESISVPKVTITPSQLTVNENNTAALFCSATGNPVPQVSWSRVNGSLPSNRSKITSEGLMQIIDIRLEDAGKYKCSAQNILGQDEKAANLVVQSKLSK